MPNYSDKKLQSPVNLNQKDMLDALGDKENTINKKQSGHYKSKANFNSP